MYRWQYILFPFALLFHLITWVRNKAFDYRWKKSTEFDTNVILVGNLSIGGTGKTPMVDYLIRYFKGKNIRVGTLSRGYGRKTYGFRLAGERETAETIGDEPYMYHCKYNGEVPVAVGADRDLAITEYLAGEPNLEVVLMDDGFQHRRVIPSLSIVLTTYENPFTTDNILPAGRLRESRVGAERADIVIVTKCPVSMSDADMVRFREDISRYTKASVFFMTTEYEAMKQIFDNGLPLYNKLIAISGMAYPEPFEAHLRKNYSVKLTHNYRDHHRYTAADARDIARELRSDISLVCTEKDQVKLKDFKQLATFSCYYQPIAMRFLRDEQLFLEMLESKLIYNVKEPI